MNELPNVLPALWKEVFTWLGQRHVTPAGPPLIRYLVIDMPKRIEIEVGVPVPKGLEGNGRIKAGILPPGRFASLIHTGPYDGIVQANADIQTWAAKRNLQWDVKTSKQGTVWGGRVEFYRRDPGNEKDPQKYETEILYLLSETKGM